MSDFFMQACSLVALLFIGSGIYYISKKLKLPSSALLVLGGIITVYLSNFEPLAFLDGFHLTNEVLFYALLPVLLFDSAYNIKVRDLIDNRYSIASLSIISLLLSALFVSVTLYYGAALLGFPIPFIVCLLFASLISATDTAAALGAFKEIGVRRRLTTIFEGESLFNDGTAIALFVVVLGIIQSQNSISDNSIHYSVFQYFLSSGEVLFGSFSPYIIGSITMICMIVSGGIIGIIIGIVFSKIIEKIEDESYLEISLTFTLAHATFLIAEALNYYILPVSAIIATVASALFIGNYGRYKISPRIEEVMEKYWGFFSFVANMLIFLGVGMLLIQLNVHWKPILSLMLITVPIVVAARFFSVFPVFGVLNHLKKEAYIDSRWQFILSWGALRGVMALMMVLLIPENIVLDSWVYYPMTIRDMLLALSVAVIAFSVFVKSLSLPYFIRKTGLNQLSLTEKILFLFEKILLVELSLKKINKTIEGQYIDKEEGEILREQYKQILRESQERLEAEQSHKDFPSSLQKVLVMHALGHQQKQLKRLYKQGEVDEKTFKKILQKIEYGLRDVKRGNLKIQNTQNIQIPENKLENAANFVRNLLDKKYENTIEKRYYEMRSFHTIMEKSYQDLKQLKDSPILGSFPELDELIDKYAEFDSEAVHKRRTFFYRHRNKLKSLSSKLTKQALHTQEEDLITEKERSFILSQRLAKELSEEMDEHLNKNI